MSTNFSKSCILFPLTFMQSSTAFVILGSVLILLVYLLRIESAGRGIFTTFRKYRYAFGLTLLKHWLCPRKIMSRFLNGFSNDRIYPGVKTLLSTSYSFISYISCSRFCCCLYFDWSNYSFIAINCCWLSLKIYEYN